jgi:hypothetical protein
MEEHRQILEMVAEGKITVDEGTKLLDALGEAPREMRERVEIHIPAESVSRAAASRAAGNIVRTGRIKTKRGARSVDRILSFVAQGVSVDYIREVQDVLDDVSIDEIVSLASEGVKPGYIEKIKDALGDVSVEEIISLSCEGVKPEYIEKIKDALGDVSVEEIISLSCEGVSPKFIEDLHEAGIDTPTVKEVLKAEHDR